MSYTIDVRHIDFHFQQQALFQDLSAMIREGEFCAVVGPNGSGKTTLLRCMAGLLSVSAGKVLVGQRDVRAYKPMELARQIAFVPQHQDTIFDVTAHDMVMMGRNPYQKRWQVYSEEDEHIVMQMMSRCHVEHFADRSISALSGGELQRTLIARAMAQQAPIMLLDEPLSNLDVSHQFEIMDILSQLNGEVGTTVVIVIHDFSMAIQYARTALLMRAGHILAHDAVNVALTPELLRNCFQLVDSLQITEHGEVHKIKM